MHNRTARKLVILFVVALCVISGRHPSINAVFAMFVGAWAMAKLFKYLFGPDQDFEDLAWYNFFPRPLLIKNLLALTTKQGSFVLVWWLLGILVAFVTFKLLNFLLVAP